VNFGRASSQLNLPADTASVARWTRDAGTIRRRADDSRDPVLHDECMTFSTFAPAQSLIAREILRKAPGRSVAQDQPHVLRIGRRLRHDPLRHDEAKW
jgi:hypothetical protein